MIGSESPYLVINFTTSGKILSVKEQGFGFKKSIIDQISEKMISVIEDLIEEEIIINSEILISPNNSEEINLKVCGARINNEVLIVGQKNEENLSKLFFKYLNREFQKMLNNSEKTISDKLGSFEHSLEQIKDERYYLLEITKLNNELSNLQRSLTKKNFLLEKTTKRLEIMKKELETFMETVPIGVVVVSSKGNIEFINKNAQEFVLNHFKIQLKNETDFFELNDRSELIHQIKEIVRKNVEIEKTIEIEDFEKWVLMRSKKIILPEEVPEEGLIFSLNDISKIKRYEQIRSNFISMASHELKTPLSVINLSVESLEQFGDQLDASKSKEFLGFISKNSKILQDIIEDLLVLFQADEGRIHLHKSMVNVSDVIDYLLTSLALKIDEKDIFIDKDIAENLDIYVDKKRIIQVFRIIIDNAVKFSSQGGTITIIALEHYSGEYNPSNYQGTLFEIRDEGIGIEKKDLPHIFERFYRASNANEIKGTGLGLSIAKELINLHGGDIFVRSKVGTGTTFFLFIPEKKI